MPKPKRKAGEIIHLALMYGILDRRTYADGIAPPPSYYPQHVHDEWEEHCREHYEEALSEIEDMQRYHEQRFGWRIPT